MASALETIMQQILASQGAGADMDPRHMAGPQMAPGPYMPEVGLQDTRGQGGRFDGSLDALAQFLATTRGPQMGRYASQGDRFLAGLARGAGNAWGSSRLSEQGERELFAQREDQAAQARTKARDEAFRTARTHAEGVRKDKARVLQQRAEQMQRALAELQQRAATATDNAGRQSLMNQASRIRQDLDGVLAHPLMADYPKQGLAGTLTEVLPRPVKAARPAPIKGTVEAKAVAAPKPKKLKQKDADMVESIRGRQFSTRAEANRYLDQMSADGKTKIRDVLAREGYDIPAIVNEFQ